MILEPAKAARVNRDHHWVLDEDSEDGWEPGDDEIIIRFKILEDEGLAEWDEAGKNMPRLGPSPALPRPHQRKEEGQGPFSEALSPSENQPGSREVAPGGSCNM
ncbi:hypothetical protein JB92DRAFT_2832099 [Gautieria morchelliformis]|nr:hypothetical protein JB92DRAFT_2832099 [Gautieria morchelliformis]